jgi:hypothetical protein
MVIDIRNNFRSQKQARKVCSCRTPHFGVGCAIEAQ